MSWTIEEFDVDSISDDRLRPIASLANTVRHELEPRWADMSLDEYRMFSHHPGRTERHFVVRDGDTVGGTLQMSHRQDGTNPEMVRCLIQVDMAHRRRGLGSMLLEQAADAADEGGRSQLLGSHFDTAPAGAAFVAAIGADEKLSFHQNVLAIRDLDIGLLRQWSDDGAGRAPGYTVKLINGLWPEEILGDMAHLYFVLERDMPMSEGHEPSKWTADLVDEMQQHYGQGTDSVTAIAVHEETGQVVGMSQLARRHIDPKTWIVTTTMVDPEHRGHSLGKWVKAEANLAALEQWPDGQYQVTTNAFTNEPMLAINRKMGFEHEFTSTDAELSVSAARRYLSAR